MNGKTKIINIKEWQEIRSKLSNDMTIGFIPTMGAFHKGHLSLIQKSKEDNQITIVSIFVNPTQFNNIDDLKNYPKSFDHDLEKLNNLQTDYLLIPSIEDIYPDSYKYSVDENSFSKVLCGKKRDGHFKGVLTIVMKLLNIVRPTHSYFGDKDFQQLSLIKGMVDAFFLNVKIISIPTVREVSGLAMSSRNKLLSTKGQVQAAQIYKELSSDNNTDQIKTNLTQNNFTIDYIEEYKSRVYAAVFLEGIRLIDNVQRQ